MADRDPIAGPTVLAEWVFFIALFVALDPDGSVWKDKFQKLEAYEAIAPTPAVLQQALDRYWVIGETLAVAELGLPYKSGNTVIQCFPINTPKRNDTYAGL